MSRISREKYVTLFLRESLQIEGIARYANLRELEATLSFLELDFVKLAHVEFLVNAFQPSARLRVRPGDTVTVGCYVPPPGGMGILYALNSLLDYVNCVDGGVVDPYQTYCRFENLHPFTDGNGRVGRVLWLWVHLQNFGETPHKNFLESFHIQALEHFRGD